MEHNRISPGTVGPIALLGGFFKSPLKRTLPVSFSTFCSLFAASSKCAEAQGISEGSDKFLKELIASHFYSGRVVFWKTQIETGDLNLGEEHT